MSKPAWIGTSVTRKEDERLLRGAGRFVDDVEAAGALHMAVLRCPHPHARLAHLDVSRARALPGVAGVLTSVEVLRRTEPLLVLRPLPDVPRLRYYATAAERALYEGQPVASVVAADRYAAEDALEAVDVDWEPLPPVTDAEAGLVPDAPRLHAELPSNLLIRNPRTAGDPARALAAAHAVVRDRFRVNRVTGLPIEGRAILVRWRRGVGALEVWASTQVPHLFRMALADALRLSEADIRVIAGDVGGGFGLKLGVFPEDVLACLHAIDLGVPVKWVEDRHEHFRASTHAREAVHDAALAADGEGRLVAAENVYLVDAGAFNSPFGPPRLTSFVFPGPYRVAEGHVERRVALTNKTPCGAYRGFGQPESNFVREVLMDRLARRLRVDPVELRRRNLLTPDELPFLNIGGATYDSGDYRRCLDLAVARIGYDGVRARQADRRGGDRHLGVGVSCFVEMTGYPGSAWLGGRKAKFGAFESVTVRLDRAGGAALYTGVSAFGQSTETSFAQVCAAVLGIDPRDVRVHAGDTHGTPYNVGGFASRTTVAGTGAVHEAAAAVRAKALRLAGHLLGRPAGDLQIAAGVVRSVEDPSLQIDLAEVARQAFLGHRLPPGESPGLEATAYFDPPASAYGYGTAAAVVEVSARTGEFTIERFLMVHDCGTQVNPMVVEGQLHGALAQGLGAALFEELVYDAGTGQLVNGTMLDYFVPTAADLPPFELDHTETPSPVTTFGVRGIGESGTIPPAAALVNAVCDALAAFGVEISRLPLTPERIWRALRERGAVSSP
jgi:carbon-monoxide dehydrogenase large subunit